MRTLKIIIALVVILLVVVGIIQSKQSQTADTIKIGIVAPITGDVGFLGDNIVKSAELALAELGRTDVELVIEDVGDFSNQGRVPAVIQKMVEVDGVEYIIDGMLSNGTLAAAPLVDQYQVVMVTPLTGGENIDLAAEYLFRNGPSDIIAGTKPANELYNDFGIENVALITDNGEYTLDIVKHFKATYPGTIVVDEIVSPDGTDYRTRLLKVLESDAEALFINTATGVSARHIIKQAGELGLDVPIFANFLAFTPDLIEHAGEYAEGVYIYDPEWNETSPAVTRFMDAYETEFGFASPIPFHTTGTYDAVKMGLEAIDAVGYDGEAIHDYLLANIKNWDGYNGSVTFDANGNTQTGFVLKQIQNGSLIPADQ